MAAAGQRVGEFVLVEVIRAGAFGQVWQARHHQWSDQLVAIKLPTDLRYVRKLQKQGSAVHRLVHPNVVRAIGCDPFADPPYLTMEYVPGSSLRPLVRDKSLSVPQAVSVVTQMLEGLRRAHSDGLLHLDIKPENVLIHERAALDGYGNPGMVKLTDFGVGAAATATAVDSIVRSDSIVTANGVNLVGTLAYLAPEQRDGHTPDARADLYACGVVLFELLTGERPAGTDLPSESNPEVPKALDDVFRRAYARLDRRFATADQFLEALAAVKTGADPVPHPVPPPLPTPAGAPVAASAKIEAVPTTGPVPGPNPPDLVSEAVAFDELARQPVPSAAVLTGLCRHLFETRPLSTAEIDKVRPRLTAWADSIPHHPIRQFGQTIKIDRMVMTPYYRRALDTQYESRRVERRQEPYRGARLPVKATTEQNIRVWDMDYPLVLDFKSVENEYRVDDSQEACDCHPCKTTGKVDCGRCASKGSVDCPTCDARGNVPCMTCTGRGTVTRMRQEVRFRNKTEYRVETRHRYRSTPNGGSYNEAYDERVPYTVQEQYTVQVPYQETCPTCSGRTVVPCGRCNGMTQVTCETCDGRGVVTCAPCDGNGKVVSYLTVVNRFEPAGDCRVLTNRQSSHDCSALITPVEDFKVLLHLSNTSFAPGIADAIANPALRESISTAIATAAGPVDPSRRIVRQSLAVARANVVSSEYAYGDRPFTLCLYGARLSVLAPVSPISEVTDRIVDRAAELLDAPDIKAGLKELRKSFDMGQSDGRATTLLSALRSKLSWAYMQEADGYLRAGLGPDSLYFSDRAKVLLPLSPAVATHHKRIATRAAVLHWAPAAGIAFAMLVMSAAVNPALAIGALAAAGAGLIGHFVLGMRVRSTGVAVGHSLCLSILLSAAVAMVVMADGQTPVAGLVTAAVVIVAEIILLTKLRAKLLQPPPPLPLPPNGAAAVDRIRQFVTDDWGEIGPGYLDSKSPVLAYANHMQTLETREAADQVRREREADVAAERFQVQITAISESIAGRFLELMDVLTQYVAAVNNDNIRQLVALGPAVQEKARRVGQSLSSYDKAVKAYPQSLSVDHGDGRQERVKLQIGLNANAVVEYIEAIRPIAHHAGKITVDRAKSMTEIARHMPKAQSLIRRIASSSAAPVQAR